MHFWHLQFCNIGSQDMSEDIWLPLAKRVNQILESGKYDAVLITHGTDTMERTSMVTGAPITRGRFTSPWPAGNQQRTGIL